MFKIPNQGKICFASINKWSYVGRRGYAMVRKLFEEWIQSQSPDIFDDQHPWKTYPKWAGSFRNFLEQRFDNKNIVNKFMRILAEMLSESFGNMEA